MTAGTPAPKRVIRKMSISERVFRRGISPVRSMEVPTPENGEDRNPEKSRVWTEVGKMVVKGRPETLRRPVGDGTVEV